MIKTEAETGGGSPNLTPEATAVGSTGCVIAVLRRCGYSRRASALRWASTCVAGVDAAVFAGHAFVCPTPTPLSVSDALADGLWLEIESPSASCVVLGLDALAVGPLR